MLTPGKEKAELRRRLRARLAGASDESLARESAQIRERLARTAAWQSARNILLYAALPREVDLWPLLQVTLGGGRAVALPRFVSETGDYEAAEVRGLTGDLVTGAFGVREPAPHCPVIPLNQLDLVVVPGLAFDVAGLRLGRGKGFYDRLLALVRGAKCGVAFEFQVLPAIPAEPHDMELNCLVTPTRTLEFPAGRRP
jgi:5-formyltetrahydrofolate cyclo-ligase